MKKDNILLIILLTIFLISSLSLYSSSLPLNTKKVDVTKSKGKTAVANLPKEKIEKDIRKKEVEIIEKAITKNIGNYVDSVSVYYENLKTKTNYEFNTDTYFMGASVRKLGNVMGTADLINDGTLSKDTLISYNQSSDYEEGTGILQNEKIIKPLTVEKTIELSIVYSDNIATRMMSKVGSWSAPYYEKITKKPAKNGTLTAKQVGILLERLYKNPENNPIYTDIINHMKNTVFHDRLDKYIPHHKVAHKIGTNYGYYHDTGIVYGNDHDYILVILTKNIGSPPIVNGYKNEVVLKDNEQAACEVIAKISKDIYNNLNSLVN